MLVYLGYDSYVVTRLYALQFREYIIIPKSDCLGVTYNLFSETVNRIPAWGLGRDICEYLLTSRIILH